MVKSNANYKISNKKIRFSVFKKHQNTQKISKLNRPNKIRMKELCHQMTLALPVSVSDTNTIYLLIFRDQLRITTYQFECRTKMSRGVRIKMRN